MKRKRFQILFYIRRNRTNKEGKVPIYLRLTLKKKYSVMALNRFVDPDDWEVKKGIVRYGSSSYEEINNHIDLISRQIYDAQKTLIEDEEEVTPQNIILILKGDYKRTYSLLEIFRYHNEDMKSKLGHGFTEGSYKNYRLTFRHLSRFLPKYYKVKDIAVSKVDHKFISDFDHYLRVDRQNAPNGSMKNLVRLKKVIRIALNHDWMKQDPFRNFQIRIQKSDRVFLTQEELTKIEEVIIQNVKLCRVRDMFLFMCYTGLSYVDFYNLTQDKITNGIDGNLWIIGSRVKSKIRFSIPLLPKAEHLVNKYMLPDRDNVFPVISNQKMNDYIKDIAKLCCINKPISCHSARHTFATTVTLSNGVPIETVSKMLGHTDLRTTQIYAKVIDNKISYDMGILKEKLSQDSNDKSVIS